MQVLVSGLARRAVGPTVSVAAACALLVALHRSLLRAGVEAELLMLGAFRDFRPGEWTLVLGVAAACAIAVVNRRRDWLIQVQGWSLAAGLLLTQLSLGTAAGTKVDPRFVYALISGMASALDAICASFGTYELRAHWQQGEFHHDVVLEVPATSAFPGHVLVVATNCNGGVKEILALEQMPDRGGLWHMRCPVPTFPVGCRTS